MKIIKQSSRNIFVEIIKDSIKYIPSSLLPALFGLISISIFTLLISPNEYGNYILVITTVGFIENIGFGWLNYSSFRFFEEAKENILPFLSTCLLSLIVLLSLMTCILLIAVPIMRHFKISPHSCRLIYVSIPLLISMTVFDTLLIFLRANREATRYSIYKSVYAFAHVALPLLLIKLYSPGYAEIVYGIALSYFIVVLYEVYRSSYYRMVKVNLFSKELFQKLYHYGMPLVGAGVTTTTISIADRYMIAYLCDKGQLGIYSAGYRLAEMAVDAVGSILLLAYLPVVIKAYNENKGTQINEILQEPFKILFIVLIPITFGAIYLAKDIVTIFLGKGFREAYTIFVWICPGIFLSNISQVYTRIFEMKKITKPIFYITMIAALVNVLLNGYWIPKFGYLGAAYATFIAYFIEVVLLQKFSKKIAYVGVPYRTLLNATVASSFMCLGLYVLFKEFSGHIYLGLPLKIISGALLYSCILVIIKDSKMMQFLNCCYKRKYN